MRGVIPASELDGRTDLYSLGCVFYEMLTGRLPFRSDSYEGWFEQHVNAAPVPPGQLRPELADGRLSVWYHENRLPIDPRTYGLILAPASAALMTEGISR